MTIETDVQNLVTQTSALENTIKTELLDVDQDISKLRTRVTDLEIRAGIPTEKTGGIPGGGSGAITYPNTGVGNSVIKVDANAKVFWLWNPATGEWVSIPFTEISPAITLDVQAIIDQANTSIDSSISSRVDTLVQSIKDTYIANVTATTDSLASEIDTVAATANGHTAAIQTETQARIAGDAALTSQVNTLASSVDANHQSFLAFQSAVVADTDSAAAQYLSQMQSDIASNKAAIQTEASTRATVDASIASQVNTLVSSIDSVQAAVQAEATARTSADSATATTLSNLASRMGTAEAAISTVNTTISTGGFASAASVSSLTTTVNGMSATVSDMASSLNGIEAKRTLAINANNRVTGIEMLDGTTGGSQIKFAAGSFLFYDPSTLTETTPFAISGGKAYINQAAIKDADITTLKLAGNAVTQAQSVSSSPQTEVNSTAYVTKLKMTVTVSGTQPIEVWGTALAAGSHVSTSADYDLYYDGYYWKHNTKTSGQSYRFVMGSYVAQGTITNVSVPSAQGTAMSIAGLFTGVPAGTYELQLQVAKSDSTTENTGIRQLFMSMLETKR